MATYRIKPVEQTLAEQKAKREAAAANPQPTAPASTAPKQTVQIKNATGGYSTVTAGSNTHQNYLKNNPTAIDQSSVKTTYNTPSVYHHSDNVKSFDQNGQQTYSVSGYTGASNPTFNVSTGVTDMVNQIKNQEALMRQTWATPTKDGYNDLIRSRNNQTGQLLDLITRESGGKASLSEIESILGRQLEPQEMQSYREAFSGGSTLQQSQLNNLWEHDFATRNNGEHYQYLTNYLTNGTGGEVLGESMLNYLNGMTPEAKAQYTQSMADSLGATQNYFTQRATGWTPDYVNNTANPLPWGEVDAGDVINNGGAGMQQQYENYLWMLQNPNYDYANMQPGQPQGTLPNMQLPNMQLPQAQSPINLNVTNQSPAFDMTTLMNLLNSNQTPAQQISPQGNLSSQNTQDDTLNKYLMSIWNGGI